MGAETFIEFNSKGFWIHSAFIEVLSDFICEVFENIGVTTFSADLQSIYRCCDSNRRGESMGMVDIRLDGTITSETEKMTFLDILNRTKTLIALKGIELSTEMLEDFESRKTKDLFKDPWFFPIKTRSLTATIDIIIQMLNNEWEHSNYSLDYKGFPNRRKLPEI